MKIDVVVRTASTPAAAKSRTRLVTVELHCERRLREAEIDATLADSFPASDPPSWTLGVSGDVST
jgi:hypothetical protein